MALPNAAELARRGVGDHRAALGGWCVGTVAYVALIAAIYPSLAGSGSLDQLVSKDPDALKSLFGISGNGSLSSGAGFLDAELFSFMLPLLVLVLAIGSGVRTFAGEEDAGRLELILAYPVRRRYAVLAKGAAVGAEVIAVRACSGVAIGVLNPIFDLGLALGNVAQAVLGLAVLGLFLRVARSRGRRRHGEAGARGRAPCGARGRELSRLGPALVGGVARSVSVPVRVLVDRHLAAPERDPRRRRARRRARRGRRAADRCGVRRPARPRGALATRVDQVR